MLLISGDAPLYTSVQCARIYIWVHGFRVGVNLGRFMTQWIPCTYKEPRSSVCAIVSPVMILLFLQKNALCVSSLNGQWVCKGRDVHVKEVVQKWMGLPHTLTPFQTLSDITAHSYFSELGCNTRSGPWTGVALFSRRKKKKDAVQMQLQYLTGFPIFFWYT